MEKGDQKIMIEHISPLYVIAMVLAVILILVILTGFVFVDWEQIWEDIKGEYNEGFDPSWMDEDKWRESK